VEWSAAVPYTQGNYIHCAFSINVSTERLNWRQMLQQMRESTLRQTLQVRVASKNYKRFILLLGQNDVVHYDVTWLTSGPYFSNFSNFSLLFDQEPYYSLLFYEQPYYPYFLRCHVVKLKKAHLKHVFLH